ncbi:hypothetical protein GYA19_03480 [Candidatus Beckwithbacteria bacterium]|nr:hypothetical protein [Candidatus Beckwithbacteria bacterium]
MNQAKDENKNQIQIDINLDKTPILYTENVFISSSAYGITFDIAQKVGPTNKFKIVARIAMSRKHTKKFLTELGKTLAITEEQAEKN